MVSALFWGSIAGASLIIGGLLALFLPISKRLNGLIMAFGAGVLISAISFELVEEAVRTSAGSGGVAAGLFAGAMTFYGGDLLIDRLGGVQRKSSSGEQASGSALPIVLGTVLDGIPESIVLGLSLLSGEISISILAAIFISNIPEAIAGTKGLDQACWPHGRIMGMWGAVALLSTLAAVAGYTVFASAAPSTIAFVQAFAGGALLTMLADTMMPEAFEFGGKEVGLLTTLGFAVAFALRLLE
ncbi:MAG: ZIP family zinc transporter [Chloroflexi bacterium]|nr:MAG: ZIP family zinc transporter [Chloroflexota bacterium]